MTQEVYIYRKPGKYGVENERYMQENIIEKVLVNKVEPLKVELKTFLDCVKTRQELPCHARRGPEEPADLRGDQAGISDQEALG